MLSHDLALLYGVEPRVLVQAVKRNAERFPDDFVFQLIKQETPHRFRTVEGMNAGAGKRVSNKK